MSFTMCIQQASGCYEVFCQHCQDSIGTMTGETMLRAIVTKGSICCPLCNETRCDLCGHICRDDAMFFVVDDVNIVICNFCEMEGYYRDDPKTKVVKPGRAGDLAYVGDKCVVASEEDLLGWVLGVRGDA